MQPGLASQATPKNWPVPEIPGFVWMGRGDKLMLRVCEVIIGNRNNAADTSIFHSRSLGGVWIESSERNSRKNPFATSLSHPFDFLAQTPTFASFLSRTARPFSFAWFPWFRSMRLVSSKSTEALFTFCRTEGRSRSILIPTSHSKNQLLSCFLLQEMWQQTPEGEDLSFFT